MREAPVIPPGKPGSNVKGALPDGQVVRAVTGQAQNGFLEASWWRDARFAEFAFWLHS